MTSRYDLDATGVATLTLDGDGAVNVINDATINAFEERLTAALSDDAVKGAIVGSTKAGFLAGGDLDVLYEACLEAAAVAPEHRPVRARKIYDEIMPMHRLLRRMETSGKPIVAVIEGAALGGGFELCLACHHRIAIDTPAVQIGLPEVLLGLMPNAGGTQRLPRLIGSEKALPLLIDGTKLDAQAAADLGLVELAGSADAAVARARAWIADHPEAAQPWDMRGFRVPGGKPSDLSAMEVYEVANVTLRRDWYGSAPARKAILSAAYEGLHVTLDEALPVEAAFFADLAMDPQTVATLEVAAATPARLRRTARRTALPLLKINATGPLGAELHARAERRGVSMDRTTEGGVALIVHDGAKTYRLWENGNGANDDRDAVAALFTTDAGFAVAEVSYTDAPPQPLLTALAGLGIAPIAVRRAGGRSFTQRLSAALSRRAEELAADGAPPHMLHRARRLARFRGAVTPPQDTDHAESEGTTLSVAAMAASLTEALVSEMRQAVSNNDVAGPAEARLLAVAGCGAPATIATTP